MGKKKTEYSFCESNCAGPHALWHIRELTKEGRKLGGGITTESLCGHVKERMGWDLDVPIVDFHLKHNTCKRCAVKYLLRINKEQL